MSARPSSVVVVGLQWGDEGKGKIVDLLSAQADVVARFQGGHNAGHTLVVDGVETVLHLIPSGALHPDTVCVIGGGVVVDPSALVTEVDAMRARGLLANEGALLLSQEAHLILPYHRAVDQARERARGKGKIGTTGRGIGPAYEDKAARTGLRMADLADRESLRAKVSANLTEKNAYLNRMLDGTELDEVEVVEEVLACSDRLQGMVVDTSAWLHEQITSGKRVLFEGAQGVALDVDHGSYPFVTSSNTSAGAVCSGAGVAPKSIGRVIGITKAYCTRVGSGPFPSELNDAIGEQLRANGSEFGATTGRPRRCGWFDAVLVRKSVRLSGVDALALTKLDVLGGLETVRMCTGYELDGKPIDHVPALSADLDRVQPVYEDWPGWEGDLRDARSREDLPETARRYVDRLEELVGVPVEILSVGPERSQTILSTDPYTGSSL